MKKYSTLILTILLVICIQPAGAQWSKAQSFEIGKVQTLAAKGDTLFSGTDTGGVYISTDFGQTWTEKNSGLSNKNILKLVVKDTVIIAALGNGFGGAFSLSTDRGESWINPANNYFGAVFGLEEQGDDVLAGTWYGVAKTTNGGHKWITLPIAGLPSNASVTALHANGSTLFACVSASSTGGKGIFRSTNNGDTWTNKNSGITNTNFSAMVKSGNTLLVATKGGGVYTSADNGDNWAAANTGLTNLGVNCLLVSGNNILAGTNEGIFLSTDNAANWTEISTGLPASTTVNTIITSGPYLVIGTNNTVWRRKTSDIITSVPKIENGLPVSVYPNPSNGAFTVELFEEYTVTELSVTNSLGQVVYKNDSPNGNPQNSLQIEIPNASEGIYFIQIKTTGGVAAKRIVVK